MIKVRRANERGHADHGWLNTNHTFSFASYHDREHVRFRSLRVMNEDRVAPGKGFGTHAHANMEIISYVLSGSLEHKDNMGNGGIISPGEFQRISAGSGITRSEFNPSSSDPVHFYQIWLEPNRKNITPSYEQKKFDLDDMTNQLRLVASPTADDGSLLIQQDARGYLSTLEENEIQHDISPDRHGWLQVLSGNVSINGQDLRESDGASISHESNLLISAERRSEFLFFDLK